MAILTEAERAGDEAPREFPRGVSPEERLMAIADRARRVAFALDAARKAQEALHREVAALIALAISGDVEGR